MDFKELMANASIVMNVTLILITVTPVRIVSILLARLNVPVNRALERSIVNVLTLMNVILLVLATTHSKHVSIALVVIFANAVMVTSRYPMSVKTSTNVKIEISVTKTRIALTIRVVTAATVTLDFDQVRAFKTTEH